MEFQKTGYKTDTLYSNLSLGITDGLEGVLWSYVFATIIFSGVLSVFIPVGLWIIILGWAVVSIFITVTSRLKIHVVTIDEQAVVILGSIGVLLIAQLGDEAASSVGLATMLAIMSITTLSIAVVLCTASRLRIPQLLELLPYPVICGYMAGVAWLLLDAGVLLSVNAPITFDLWHVLTQDNNAIKLALSVAGGLAFVYVTNVVDKAWSLPAASVAIVLSFYGVAYMNGLSKDELVAGGWIFDVQVQSGGVQDLIFGLSFADIDFGFVASVIPQILTIIFLTMLSSSMNLSIMASFNPKLKFNTSEEMKGLGIGNFMLGLFACPPGYSDAVTSSMYESFGASSRWMPITSSVVCLIILFVGASVVSYLPNVLICASILLFAFQMSYDWLYANVRSFSPMDYAIVCLILITVIGFGFIEGIMLGVFLTVFLFVLRYSMISAIQGSYTLNNQRSSVERALSSNLTINRHGGEAIVYTLRGFLFFGSANAIRDIIRKNIDSIKCATILFDLRRVTGIDISALNTFVQIKQICEVEGILVLYSGASPEIEDKINEFDMVSKPISLPLYFTETDFALEYMEDVVLSKYEAETITGSINNHLLDILGCEKKVSLLSGIMEKVEFEDGEYLFKQGDIGSSFYMLETGSMTALIDLGHGTMKRVKKFSTGSVIGEMSSYSKDNKRTATVMATKASVLYSFVPDKLKNLKQSETETMAVIHELVARTLGGRIDYMNRRLMLELA